MAAPTLRTKLTAVALEDRLAPAGVHADYTIVQSWGSGYQAQVRIVNDDNAAVAFNTLQFDLPANITSVWDAKMTAHAGNHYTVTNNGWNSTIAAHGEVSFGFTASTAGATATHFTLNGTSLDAPTTPTVPPTVPPTTPTVPPATPPAPAPAPTPAVGSSVTFKVDSDWGTGSTAGITIKNTGTTAASGWSLSFDVPANVTSIWGAVLKTHVGNRYTVGAADWNGSIPAGGSVSFGINLDKGKVAASNFALTLVGTSTPAPAPAPTPAPAPAPAPTPAPASVGSRWPGQTFAPYVDATLYPTYNLVSAMQTTGLKYFTLGFVTATADKQAGWGGFSQYAINGSDFDLALRAQVAAVRARGGDVAVSFGGASGNELAQVITDVNALAAAYRNVVKAYGLTHVDFDIEGGAAADKASIDRRNAAIAILQQEAASAGKELNVRYTLAVLPTGLDATGLYVMQSAKQYGVRVDVVNVMAMDYGDAAAPNPAGKMGDYAIQAATSVFNQLGTLYGTGKTDAQKWAMIGVTPMIGLNDVTSEKFTQDDARKLEKWADQHHIGLLSMWSLNRDKANAAGAINYVDLTSSSLAQSPNEFAGIFLPFTG